MQKKSLVYAAFFGIAGMGCAEPTVPLSTTSMTQALESCESGIDDDSDGLADCMDPDCEASPACASSGVTPCKPNFYLTSNMPNIGLIESIDAAPTPVFTQSGDTNSNINATCYNLSDGFVYGIRQADDHLVRLRYEQPLVGNDFYRQALVQDLGAVRGLPNLVWTVADCDAQDRMWVKQVGINDTYLISGLSAFSGIAPFPASTLTSTRLDGNDMAYDPGTNRLYSLGNGPNVNTLYIHNIVTATTTNRAITGAIAAFGNHGAVYVDSDGSLYGFNETTGSLRRIDVATGAATWVGSLSLKNQSDGFSCALAAPPSFEICGDGVDNDGDGVTDEDESTLGGNNCILLRDSDGDGVANVFDLDDDNDGIPDSFERGDVDRDGSPGRLDLDSDGDACLDLDEAGHDAIDANGDGVIDGAPADFGQNGLFDGLESAVDSASLDYDSDAMGGDMPSENASVADAACAEGPAEICDDEIDNDGDSDVDCDDTDCSDVLSCTPEVCNDAQDNNGNGDVDCDDADCSNDVDCGGEDCGDGVDNNDNGDVDCDDAGCAMDAACFESRCNDGLDNDDDLDIDCDDADCATDAECIASGRELCTDEIDNDEDGDIDCDDSDCAIHRSCVAEGSGVSLSGGGCSQAGGPAGGRLALVGLLLLALGLSRRRLWL